MKAVSVDAMNIISKVGNTSEETFANILNGMTGVELHHRKDIDDEPIWASLIDDLNYRKLTSFIDQPEKYTRFENLQIASISEASKTSNIDLSDPQTIFLFSTTKGNISILEKTSFSDAVAERTSLYHSGKLIAAYFNNTNEPVIISNACISGVVALMHAQRLLKSGIYKNAVVVGADVITQFVYSGFKSFQALSSGRCAPFSAERNGINLGEAAATIILTTDSNSESELNSIKILEGSVTNDSNHISGPSRTGDELKTAIQNSIKRSGVSAEEIGFISAHGTATLYNDEMEAKAFYAAGLGEVPINSLKGYFGHTLGAAGVVESAISILSLIHNTVIPTAGFVSSGVTSDVTICSTPLKINSNYCLKTASGFGGCNAALIFSKS